MRLLIPVLIIGMIFFAGYVMGSYRRNSSPKLTRPERKELATLRSFKSGVRSTASDHYELEPNFARIIMDEVDKADKELDNARNS